MHLNGRLDVARRKPFDGTDPDDRAYDWHFYDRDFLTEARTLLGADAIV